MYRLLRPLLFSFDPERTHHATIRACELAGAAPWTRALVRLLFAPRRDHPVVAFGLTFRNPIGLAAGFDKDARAWRALAALGFGHVEVGTVTPRPQPGNDRPRLFRLREDASLINRLGFPGEGAEAIAARIDRERPFGAVVGVNLGKNRDTPLERAAEDYGALVDRFAAVADYLVVNVSSPNTVGLRDLQARTQLHALLSAVLARRAAQPRTPPVLVKLSPDLDDTALDDALTVITDLGIDGVIATNTTLDRPGSLRSPSAHEPGGLSGKALRERSTAMIAAIHRRTTGTIPIVGTGGIFDSDDAKAKLDAGARLVQLYTGLIYRGPTIVRQILRTLT